MGRGVEERVHIPPFSFSLLMRGSAAAVSPAHSYKHDSPQDCPCGDTEHEIPIANTIVTKWYAVEPSLTKGPRDRNACDKVAHWSQDEGSAQNKSRSQFVLVRYESDDAEHYDETYKEGHGP